MIVDAAAAAAAPLTDVAALEQVFQSCRFSPATTYHGSGRQTAIREISRENDEDRAASSAACCWKTMAFFIDSSGRSSFSLPLQMEFVSQTDLDTFLEAKCLDPAPSNLVMTADGDAENNDLQGPDRDKADEMKTETSSGVSLLFEIQNITTNDGNTVEVNVEGLTIEASRVDDLVVSFDTTVTVRATTSRGHNEESKSSKLSGVRTRLEVTPLLQIPPPSVNHERSHRKNTVKKIADSFPDLMTLDLTEQWSLNRPRKTRLPSVALDVTLTHAFEIAIRHVPAATHPGVQAFKSAAATAGGLDGTTMISLTIRHSNSHTYPIKITNVAMHPGHSRTQAALLGRSSRSGGSSQQTLINMTQSVQIRPVDKTKFALPLTLEPREAYSTVLCITAGEDMQSRVFVSPLSVTGVVLVGGNSSNGVDGDPVENDDDYGDCCRVVVAGEAHWSTMRVAVEPEDAFRVVLSVPEYVVPRGEPIPVKVRIFNLNLESRNVMLLVAKDRHQLAAASSSPALSSREKAVNTAVVSEANGYTFGVWGITEGDDGTSKLNRDSDLLAIDSALLLGDVPGQHAVDAELRFVPLRLGRLKIPDLKLYDQLAQRWYTCLHSFSVVAK